MPLSERTYGRWTRRVDETHAPGVILTTTEFLDEDEAVKRLYEAMRERPEGGVRNWLDVALNGWGDD